jgi:hypothetical protein
MQSILQGTRKAPGTPLRVEKSGVGGQIEAEGGLNTKTCGRSLSEMGPLQTLEALGNGGRRLFQ